MPTVSVIIPAYNECYVLPRCLDAVLGQTWQDMEIIVVDDGSTDGTPGILEDYAARDGRIRVVRQVNAGVSAARNAGIAAARGEYVQFVDADDWPLPDMIETLVEDIERENVDLVGCGWHTVYPDDPERKPNWRGVFGGEGKMSAVDYIALNRFHYHWVAFGAVWNKLYRSERLRGWGVAFREGLAANEDALFNIAYAARCDGVFLDNRRLYEYILESSPDRLPVGDRYDPAILDTMILLARKMLAEIDGKIPAGILREFKGGAANMVITSLVRLCRRDASYDDAELISRVAAVCGMEDVRDWFRHYRAKPGQTRLIPFFLAWRLPRLLFRLARSKADRRFGRFYPTRIGS